MWGTHHVTVRSATSRTSRPFYAVSHGVQRKSADVTTSSAAQELAPKVVKRQHLSPLRVDKRDLAPIATAFRALS
jgi:hypothetical protein